MIVGGKYNWKGQRERLVYIGRNWSGNGYWHQFELVGRPGIVWCEVVDADLAQFEESASAATTPPVDAVLGEPVAWVNLATLISAKIAKERGAADEQHTWCESKTSFHDTPLYERVPNSPDNPPRLRRDGESLIDYRAAMGWGAPLAAPVASRAVQAEPDKRMFDLTLECVGRSVEVTFSKPQIDALVARLREFGLVAPTAPAATAEPSARAASLAPREPLTEEQWYDIACAHATREWNSNGYMESVKSVGLAAINAALGIAASPAGAEGAGS